MKRKRTIVLAAAAISVALVAGCGNNNAGETNNNEATQKPVEGAAQSTEKPAKPFKLSVMLNLHEPEVPSDKIEKLLEEKTNTQSLSVYSATPSKMGSFGRLARSSMNIRICPS